MRNEALSWIYKTQGSKKLYILALTLVQAVNGASGVLYALFLRGIVDSAVAGSKEGFIRNAVYIVLLILLQLTLNAVIRYLSELGRASFENLFKERLMHNILRKDYGRVSAVHSGEWLNRLTNDTVVVANSMTDIIPGFAGMAVKLISALIMITVLDTRFALIMVPLGVILGCLTFAFRKNMKKLHKQVQEKDGILRIFLQERINSLTVIRSFSAEEHTEDEERSKILDHRKARLKRTTFSNLCSFAFGAAMNGMYIFGVIYCGYGILTGAITYGTLTAITQLITQIQAPFANITGYLPRWYQMLASAERLMEIEKFEDDLEGETATSGEVSAFYRDSLIGFGLEDVSYKYYPATDKVELMSKENMPYAVSNLSIDIKKGEYVAFTGHSGCGKSTALMLLMGVYMPDEGKRYLSDATGEQLTFNSYWRRLFAYVPQGNKLMSGSIRDIVSFADGSSEGAQDRIDKALKIACASEFIDELEGGIDTVLGERGKGLSEGQMQRLAIARAIYSDAPVLLLDEATSALDENTEAQLLKNLRELTDKTVVIITHRPAALEICDRKVEF